MTGIETTGRTHPLRSKPFLLIWLGLVASLIGDQLYRVALTVTIADQGAAALASLGLVLALPAAAVSLFSGSLIDRTDRFRFLAATDIIRSVVVAALAVLLFVGITAIVPVLFLAAMLALVSVVFTPAIQALLPQLGADRDRLIAMDAWLLGAVATTGVVGPALAGGLLQFVSPTVLVVANCVTFLLSAVMVLMARRHVPTPASVPAARPRGGVADGLRFLMHHPVLRPCFSTFPFMEFALYSVPFVLPLLLTGSEDLAAYYGMSLAALAIGRVCGMSLINKTRLKGHRGAVLRGNFLLQGVAVATLAWTTVGPATLAALAVAGLASGTAQIAMASYVQLEVAPEMRGRAFGAITSIVSWLQPLGAVAFGGLAAVAGPRPAFLAMGCVLVLGGIRLAVSRPLARVH